MSKKQIILIIIILILALQVNFYFAWTSHVGGASKVAPSSPALRSFFVYEVYGVITAQFGVPGVGSFFTSLAHNPGPSPYKMTLPMKLLIDTEVIIFTLAIFLLTLALFFRKGWFTALLRAVEITTLTVFPLGLEIYAYDQGQFNIHASDIQVRLGLAWFTNADVLYTSAAVLAVCLVIEAILFLKRKGTPRPVAQPYSAPQQNIQQ